ncbi:uncharacterized protein [Arachis hypogaea]|uniref:DNA-directed RNA polymerase III subunit RPC3 n=2 Tax=Arachis hypogaea TaxID=3818 RepID=A0A6B9VEL0_ARAHY|nr:uncharacterized protein LOC112777672 isoform X1 [Arachis hypogaea]XP_029151240.1 uncharacterized protein LOC112777672 isoform X1 [Arachis hypogaea]XP_029151241.1 uncharacterized protein LOC112777672 isoform X1 [Arachis hypogaea]QHN80130.1 uncharacterized protein DS421_19g675710 [Arachis hypogaea]
MFEVSQFNAAKVVLIYVYFCGPLLYCSVRRFLTVCFAMVGLPSNRWLKEPSKEKAENPGAIEAVVRESFHKLLKAHYIERCPASEPVVSTLIKAESAPRKRGSKMAKKFEAETIEQCVLEAAVPGEAIRFAVTAYTLGNADREAKSDDSSIVNFGDNSGGIANEVSILWRANFEEFIRHLRHKLLVENERKRLDDGAATTLSSILDVIKTVEEKVKIEKSVPLSLESIFTEVTKTEHGRTMTIDRVRASLVQLGCPQRNFDDSYSIDLRSIVEMARNEEVESIVLKRFGSDATEYLGSCQSLTVFLRQIR